MGQFLDHHFVGLFVLVVIVITIIDNFMTNFARAKIVVAAFHSGRPKEEIKKIFEDKE